MGAEKEKIYEDWIRGRQSVHVPEGFANRVIGEITAHKLAKDAEPPMVYRVLSSYRVQWAAAAGALLLGLFRLGYVTRAVLIP